MGDDALDPGIIRIGGGVRPGQHVLRVEDVQALVLHRPHVEAVDRDDHVDVQVVLAPEDLLVPAHRFLQGAQGVGTLVGVPGLDVDAQRHLAPRSGDEAAGHLGQPAGDQGEEVGGLGERVLPAHPVAPVAEFAALDGVPVREQHGAGLAVGHDGGRVAGHHVGPVGKIGDLAEPLGLALGAEETPHPVEPLERCVLLGSDTGLDREREALGNVLDGE